MTGAGYVTEPTWSPDGTHLAFVSRRGGDRVIVVIRADGSEEVLVSRSISEATEPVWSPDGTRIAFQAFDGRDWDIWVANADGTGQAVLTEGPGDDLAPAWSPDGTLIAFLTSVEPVEDLDLSVVGPDGTGIRKVADVPAGGGELSWQSLPPGT